MHNIRQVEAADLCSGLFKPLILPEHFAKLHSKEEAEEYLSLVAYEEEQPIACLLVALYPILHQGFIRSIIVHPDHRHQGIATALIQEMQKVTPDSIWRIDISYHSGIPHLQALLDKAGFFPSKPFGKRYIFDCPKFSPPWFKQKRSFPLPYTYFPWRNLKPDERNTLTHLEESGLIPIDVSPLGDETLIHHPTSFGLRYDQTLAGWIVTHQIDEETIRYTALFADAKHRSYGIPIALLQLAIKAQQKGPLRWSVVEINEGETFPNWLRFVKKRLAPLAHTTQDLLHAFWHR